MASTRLRKAFRYPSEADNASEPEELDEEHQERLISELQESDARKTDLYRTTFLSIPLLAAAFSCVNVFVAFSSRQRLIALLSLSSLLCTAYILRFMPLTAPERRGKKPVYQIEAEKSPVERYLVYLDAALAGLLLLAAGLSYSKGARDNAWVEALPAIILVLSLFVRQQLAPLDLEELHKARYEYKGA